VLLETSLESVFVLVQLAAHSRLLVPHKRMLVRQTQFECVVFDEGVTVRFKQLLTQSHVVYANTDIETNINTYTRPCIQCDWQKHIHTTHCIY